MNKKTLKIVTLILSCLLLIGAAIGITAAADGTEPSVEIVNKNVAYEGAVQLVFALETKNADDFTAKVVFTDGAADVAVGKNANETNGYVKNTVGSITANNTVYPLVYSDGIAAKMLRKEIVATPVLVNAEGVIAYVGASVTYSPYIYSMNRFDNASSSKEQIELYKALLDYSAAVQQVLLPQDGGDIATYGGWADEYYLYSVDGTAKVGRGIDGAPVLVADRLNETKAFAGFFEDGAQVYEYGEGKTSSAWYEYTVRPGNSGNFTLSYVDRNTAFVDSLAANKLYPGSSATGTNKKPEGANGVYHYIDSETLADESTNYFWTIEKIHASGLSDNPAFTIKNADTCNDYAVEYDFRWISSSDTRDNEPIHVFFSLYDEGTKKWTNQLPAWYGSTNINDADGTNKGVNHLGVDMYSGEWHNLRFEFNKFINPDGVRCYQISLFIDGKLIHTSTQDRNKSYWKETTQFKIGYETRYLSGGKYSDVNFDLDNIHIDSMAATNPIHVYSENANEAALKTPATANTRAVYYKSCVCGAKSEDTFEYGQRDNLAAGKLYTPISTKDWIGNAPAANATSGAYAYIYNDNGNYVYRNQKLSRVNTILNIKHPAVTGATKYVYEFDLRWNGADPSTTDATRAFLVDIWNTASTPENHSKTWWQRNSTIVFNGDTSALNYGGYNVKMGVGEWHTVRYEFITNYTEDGAENGYTCKVYIDGAEKASHLLTLGTDVPQIRFYSYNGTKPETVPSDKMNGTACYDIDNFSFTTDGGVHGGETVEVADSYAFAAEGTATTAPSYYKSYSCCDEVLDFNSTFEYGPVNPLADGEYYGNLNTSSITKGKGSSAFAYYIETDANGNNYIRFERVGSSAGATMHMIGTYDENATKYVYEFDFRWMSASTTGAKKRAFIAAPLTNASKFVNNQHNKYWYQFDTNFSGDVTAYTSMSYSGKTTMNSGEWYKVRYEFTPNGVNADGQALLNCKAFVNGTRIINQDFYDDGVVPSVRFEMYSGPTPENMVYDIDNYQFYTEDFFSTAESVSAEIEQVYNGADSVVTLVTDLDTNHWWVLKNVDELLRKHGLVANLATVAKNLYTSTSYTRLNTPKVEIYQRFLDTGRWQITNHSLHHGSYVSIDDNGNAYVDEEKLADYILTSGELIRAAFPTQKVLTYAMTGNSANKDSATGLTVSRDDEYALIGDNYIISRGWGSERDIGELVWNNISTWDLRQTNDAAGIAANSAALKSLVDNGQFAVIYNHYVYKTDADGNVIDNTTYSNPKTSSSCVDYAVVDALYAEIAQYVAEGKLWCANFEDAGKYLREAETATVKAVVVDGVVYVRVTDEMDDSIYDHALTVNITLPEALASAPAVKVTQGDKISYAAVVDGVALVNVVPDAGDAKVEAYDGEIPTVDVTSPETPSIEESAYVHPGNYDAETPDDIDVSITFNGTGSNTFSIAEDADKGNVYKYSKNSSGNPALAFMAKTAQGANKFVFEADIKYTTDTDWIYLNLFSGSTDVYFAGIQASNGTYKDFAGTGTASNVASGLKKDTWNKLKIEYIYNAENDVLVVITFNDTKMVVSNNTKVKPLASAITSFRLNGGGNFIGDIYLDNVKVYQESVTIAEPTLGTYTADTYKDIGTNVAIKSGNVALSIAYDEAKDSNVYKFTKNGSGYDLNLTFDALKVDGANKVTYEADINISSGSEFYVGFKNSSNGGYAYQSYIHGGKITNFSKAGFASKIANAAAFGVWFNLKMEYIYNGENNITVNTYIDGKLVMTSSNYYAATGAYAASAVDQFCANFSGSGTGVTLVDNVKVYQEVVDLTATETPAE